MRRPAANFPGVTVLDGARKGTCAMTRSRAIPRGPRFPAAAALALAASGAAFAEDAAPEPITPATEEIAPAAFGDRAAGPVVLVPYAAGVDGAPVYRLSPASLAARQGASSAIKSALSLQQAPQETQCVAGGFLKLARDGAAPSCVPVEPTFATPRAERATLALSEGA
jgi:hypothetical protein